MSKQVDGHQGSCISPETAMDWHEEIFPLIPVSSWTAFDFVGKRYFLTTNSSSEKGRFGSKAQAVGTVSHDFACQFWGRSLRRRGLSTISSTDSFVVCRVQFLSLVCHGPAASRWISFAISKTVSRSAFLINTSSSPFSWSILRLAEAVYQQSWSALLKREGLPHQVPTKSDKVKDCFWLNHEVYKSVGGVGSYCLDYFYLFQIDGTKAKFRRASQWAS